METLEWIPGPILITHQVQDPPGAQQREGSFWVMWGTDLIREIKYQIWREISECRTICSGRGWNSSKDLNKMKPDVSPKEESDFWKGWCLLIFQKWKWAYVFYRKFHKHNETSGKVNTYMSEVFDKEEPEWSHLFSSSLSGVIWNVCFLQEMGLKEMDKLWEGT